MCISLIIAFWIMVAEIFGIMVCGVVSTIKQIIDDVKEAKALKDTKEN